MILEIVDISIDPAKKADFEKAVSAGITDAIAPAKGSISPEMIRVSVVLPAPFGPTMAACAPSATRNETSSSNTRPSGKIMVTPPTSMCPTTQPLQGCALLWWS